MGIGRSASPIAACALLVLAACGNGAAEKGAGGPPQGPPPVTVAQPLVQRIVDWDDYVGRFEAVKTVEVRPRVSGYLQSIHFRDGETVRVGQLLFVIDPRPYEATLAQANAQLSRQRAALALARTQLSRSQRLIAAEAIAAEELDQRRAAVETAQADVAAAEADVRAAQLNVEFTRVRAPISGRISDRRVDTGNLVSGSGASTGTANTSATNAGGGASGGGGTLLTTVVSTKPIYFVFDGSEALYLKYSRQNQAGTRISSRLTQNPVEIRLQDQADYQIKGRMAFVDNAIDPGTGTIRAYATVDNADGFLTPGLFGRLRLLGSGAYDALLVPDEVVLTDQNRRTVLVVGPKNTVQSRVVEIGPVLNGLRVIRSGVGPGDRVVIDGLQLAQVGQPVKPVPGRIAPLAAGAAPAEAAYAAPPASEATPAR